MTTNRKEETSIESLEAGRQASGFAPDAPPEDVAKYIADMVLEMRNMAKDHQLEFLAYLLEMAFQEAFDLSQQDDDGRGAASHNG